MAGASIHVKSGRVLKVVRRATHLGWEDQELLEMSLYADRNLEE